MKYEVSEEIVKGLIQYLSTRPYNEVFQGIQALQSLNQIKEQDEEISA